eukprot:10017593-Heterocapsa_arctica.AAC.1
MRGDVDHRQGGHGLQPLPQEGRQRAALRRAEDQDPQVSESPLVGLAAVGRHASEDVRVGTHRAAQRGHGREAALAVRHKRRALDLVQRVEDTQDV